MSDQLEIICDNNQQYSRLTRIRIHGIEVPENESFNNIMTVVKSCHKKIHVTLDQENIDCLHRIGKKYTNEITGKIQSIIDKFKSWKSYRVFYDDRPRNFFNGKKKQGLKFFNVSVDLARWCYLLLKTAKGIIKYNLNISYFYAGINCSLAIQFKNGSFKYLKTLNELHSLL